MAFSTSFGQTFFIAIYAGAWREEFALSHGEWGAIYMVATLSSAAILTQSGRLADAFRARSVALCLYLGFALIAVMMAYVTSPLMLAFLVFGLRFCGQGMLSHLAIASMARWFRARRARAVAIASLGFSAGDAVLPAATVALIAAIGWRSSWLVVAALLALVIAPTLMILLRRERSPRSVAANTLSPGLGGAQWTRKTMLRHWLFWALLPGLIGPGWIGTVVFFQIVHLTEVKGWALIDYAGFAYPTYSACAVLASFAFGWAADRFGVVRLLPVYLLGWAAGTILMAMAQSLSAGVVALAAAGIGTGGTSIVMGALFAELYGTRWIGGIKAITAAVMVLASALGPGVSGALLDSGVTFEVQLLAMGLYLLAVSLLFVAVAARVRPLLPGAVAAM
ncbi:MAG: MFS transporter [Pseudomonadota bacterium]